MKNAFFRILSACALAFCAGCELIENDEAAFAAASGSGAPAASSSSSRTNKTGIVGTWHLKGVTEPGSWYASFDENGSWAIKDSPDAARTRVHGTYTTSGSKFVGPMVNPGVGEGRINGTWSGSSMTLYFTEYWHTPHKTVQYAGTRK